MSKIDEERREFEKQLHSHMGRLKLPWWAVNVDVYEVERAFKKWKWKKSAGVDQVQAEHLKYGGWNMAIHMSIAFMAFLRHSFVPQQWLQSFSVPIIKDKKGDSANADNYRGIAISCVASKALEGILLQSSGSCLHGSSEKQFGFKRRHSCGDCSFVLKKSV